MQVCLIGSSNYSSWIFDPVLTFELNPCNRYTVYIVPCYRVLTVCILFAMQPMKLGEHLNSLLLNMCDDVTLSRMSLRTVLDICSKHIRSSTCDPPFSYIRKLVRLVLGSLSQVLSSFFKSVKYTFSCSILPYFLLYTRSPSF